MIRESGNNSIKNKFPKLCIIVAIIYCGLFEFSHVDASKESEIVSSWAKQFGDELWELGQKMTKSNEIRAKYKQYNARVEQKGNETLIKSIVANVGRMLQRKIDAVRCILNVAEEMSEQFTFNKSEAKNYTYYSSKYSPINGLNISETAKFKGDDLPEVIAKAADTYQEMMLEEDTHFYNISVNTTHSSAHVPTNVYDKSPNVLEALMWSEALDEVFVQNYNSDPALSWQYFGSDTGIMRHYPAMSWTSKGVDVYDCRKRSWYIETATCSKDIVILLDNSGSMTGFRNYIAQLTVKSILDTFSNNDFINIFNYSKTATELVPCFNDTLIQATPENILVFNNAVKELKPEGAANVTNAYAKAFELLQRYREIRRCNETTTGCNQAIMLITDGVAGNTTEIFEKYNWIETGIGNLTKTPVRVFTYLLGKEVTKVREIQWMACLNRGYYSHIQTLDEVQGEVLQYVTVIATPLVLQGVDHPPTWTHAFRDPAYEEDDENAPVRLMIAVGVPAFDRKIKNRNDTVSSARLLGVASTDVPVEDINKLTLPYKLGVNGYSFIVSNNGYVLLHPDLRPVENGILKRNYNSIDLTEVEQFDDSNGRDPSEFLLELRRNLVNNAKGTMPNISVKFHYDKMRRISQEKYDYYFEQLPNTPYSLGLAIPSGYGNTWIKVGDEVKRNLHMGVNMSDFFVGENWKVHPEWVYCKYHYLEGHEFKTPEDELRHFLKKLPFSDWKWSQQYEAEPMYEHDGIKNKNEPNCGRKTLSDDAYYCNKELVQLLIFDAKVTNTSYWTWRFENSEERALIERYNATLRFVATMSGLTRWQFIFGEVEVDTDREFGDYHTTAVDETWYKSAILQHQIDPNSFVYFVPHESDPPEEGELKVTASHAIFPRDGGFEAPGCVVGFQFSHALMSERFMEITSKANCDNCIRTCDDEMQDCFVLDNNGYVLFSERQNDTGKFFGEIEGAIMESMVDMNIFKVIPVYDLQALCAETVEIVNDSTSLINTFTMLKMGVQWLITELFLYLSRIHLWVQGIPYYDDLDHDYSAGEGVTKSPRTNNQAQNQDEENPCNREVEKKNETIYRACDKKSNLYMLQQNLFIQANSLPLQGKSNCSRPYYFNRVPYSNLLLVVVNAEYQTCNPNVKASAEEVTYDQPFPCYKLRLNDLLRRRLEECFTEHPDEAKVAYCGKGLQIKFHVPLFAFITIVTVAFNMIV